MYTPIPVPASLKEYKSFEFLQRDLRVTGASPSAGSLHGGQVRRVYRRPMGAPASRTCDRTRRLLMTAVPCSTAHPR